MRFIQAAHYYPGRLKTIRLLVVHDMEAPETLTTAEDVADYFSHPGSRIASAHYCVDADSVVGCVHDGDTAFGAKGANADGLHLEHAGYARQTPAEWVDPYSRAMLVRSAALAAALCRKYGLPIRRLSVAQIRAGEKGLCGHGDITAAYPPGTGHTDPGEGFPWPYYLDLIRSVSGTPTPVEDDMAMSEDDWRRMNTLLDAKLRILLRGEGTDGRPSGHYSLKSVGEDIAALDVPRKGL